VDGAIHRQPPILEHTAGAPLRRLRLEMVTHLHSGAASRRRTKRGRLFGEQLVGTGRQHLRLHVTADLGNRRRVRERQFPTGVGVRHVWQPGKRLGHADLRGRVTHP
jgi:hypothetical protein